HSGKVNFRNQICTADQTIATVGYGIGKEGPKQQPTVSEDWIRYSFGFNARKTTEQQRENQHRQQALQDRPRHPQHPLLVTHLNVSPGKKIEQLAIMPEIAKLQRDP